MFRAISLIASISLAAACAGAVAGEEKDSGEVAKLLPSAKVTLQQGLTAAESQGKPISGKFEVEDGKFQLSVYTAKGGKFSEVIIDHTTGAVSKSEDITEGDDLKEAKAQSAAAAKATKSLKSAVDQAEKSAPGFRAVEAEAKLEKGHAVAAISLANGSAHKEVTEPLE